MVRNDIELSRVRSPRVLDASASSVESMDYSGGVPSTDGIVLNQTVFALIVFGVGLAIGLAFAMPGIIKERKVDGLNERERRNVTITAEHRR